MRNLFQRSRQWYRNLKLQSKFTLVLILIVSIPAVFTGIFFYTRIYDMVISYTVQQGQKESAAIAPLADQLLQKVIDVSGEIMLQDFYKTLFHNPVNESPEALASTPEAQKFRQRIRELRQTEPVTDIRIYMDLPEEASGLFTEDTTKDIFFPMSAAKGTYWHGIFQGSSISELFCPSFYMGPQELKECGDMAYIRATTIYYRGEAFPVYITVYYASSALQEILPKSPMKDGSVTYIVNDRNNLVVSSDASLSSIYWLDYETIRDSVMSSNNFIERAILDTKVYAGFYRIREPEWFLVTVLPAQALIQESHRLMLQLLAIYLGILVLAFFLANTLSRSITGRISSVSRQMKAVRQGPPVPMESPLAHDEVGDLIDTYNYMTRKMNQLMEKQAQAAEDLRIAEFNSLQAQMNPHFLYNTMDMINWKAAQGKTSEIQEAVQKLSRFYKLTLSRKQSISTIASEEEHVSIYIALQNMRFHNSIDFISDIPDELSEYQIPKLTLQPVVENAILHGILEKPDKKGTVVLTGWLENGDIVLLISDDGVGIPREKLPTLLSGTGQSASGGNNIAICNTHRRLQILYGSEYGLSYSSEPGKGTEVQLRFPAQKEYRKPYTAGRTPGSDRALPPLITVANPEAMTMNSVSPETLLEYSQQVTRNLYTLRNLHQISDRLSLSEDIYVLAHEVTGDFPPHNHDYFEVNYLCRGSIINVIDGNEVYMTAGDLVFLNKRAVHSLRYLKPDTLFINFCLKPEAFRHTLKDFYEQDNLLSRLMKEETEEQNYLFFSLAHSLHAQAVIASIIQEYADQGFHCSFSLEGYLLLLFDYLGNAGEFSYFGTDIKTHEMLMALREKCTKEAPEVIAASFDLDIGALDRHLKTRTGRGFQSHANEVKLETALKLLSRPETNLCDIVKLCRFESSKEFSELFLQKFRISPEDYRKQFL